MFNANIMFFIGEEIITSDQKIWKEVPVICFQNSKSEDLALSMVTHDIFLKKKIESRCVLRTTFFFFFQKCLY